MTFPKAFVLSFSTRLCLALRASFPRVADFRKTNLTRFGSTNPANLRNNLYVIGLPDLAAGEGTAANPAALVRPEAIEARITDALGNITGLQTNGFGSSNRTTDALGWVTEIFRDENNSPICLVYFNGPIDSFTTDPKDRPTSAANTPVAAPWCQWATMPTGCP